MKISSFPPLEPGTGSDPRVCLKGTTLRVLRKTLEFLGFLEARLCQTTVEPLGFLWRLQNLTVSRKPL